MYDRWVLVKNKTIDFLSSLTHVQKIVIAALFLTFAVLIARAGAPFVNFETESGLLDGGAAIVSDENSSGGAYVVFGPNNSSVQSRIQAQEFREGGNGDAYLDDTTANLGDCSLRAGAVDLQTNTDTSGVCHIGWFNAGEWVEYELETELSADYVLSFRVARADVGAGSLSLEINGSALGQNHEVPSTGDWMEFQTIGLGQIELEAGVNRLRIVNDGEPFNLNWIEFSGPAEVAAEAPANTPTNPAEPFARPCVDDIPAGGSNFYVSVSGNDSNDGSVQSPWRTLRHALGRVAVDRSHTINLSAGEFDESGSPLFVPSGVNIVGSGRRNTIFKGKLVFDNNKNQTISSFKMDGWVNKNASTKIYDAIEIESNSYCMTIKDMLIEGFYGNAVSIGGDQLEFYDSELYNNAKHNDRQHAMSLKDMSNSSIHDIKMVEEAGLGGEGIGSGITTITNLKMYNMEIFVPGSTAGGWEGQIPFSIEFYAVNAYGVEIYDSVFNSTLSLVQTVPEYSNYVPFEHRFSPYSFWVHHNRWDNSVKYAIEASINDIIIDHNYIDGSNSPIAHYSNNGGGRHTIYRTLIHHNVIDNDNCPFSTCAAQFGALGVKDFKFYNNTVIGTSDRTFFYFDNQPMQDAEFANNIFIGSGSNPFLQAISQNPIVTNNLFNGIQIPAFSVSHITSQPNFASSGNRFNQYYRLNATSPAIDAGKQLPPYTDGFNGSAPDLGAFEYGGGSTVGPRN